MEDSTKKILTILGITAGVGAVAYLLLKPSTASAAVPKVGTSLTPAQLAQVRAQAAKSGTTKTSNTSTNALTQALAQLLNPSKTNAF